MNQRPLTPEKYYRLPWNLADNAITWLEPTTKCNMYCDGCYRANDPDGHRPLGTVIAELEQIKKLRQTDGISIAGGEPLIYPHIVELVSFVASQGWKPIIITNGSAMTPELVKSLKDAGLVGFTVHVDSHQTRPGGWTGKSEAELNELRLQLARMIHETGGGTISCAFNATIYRDTLADIPVLARWAQDHVDLVHTMVFILYRSVKRQASFDHFVNGKLVDPAELVYQLDHQETHQDVMTQEVVDRIREVSPHFEPNAFLSGNVDTRAMKWLLALRVGNKERILGYLDNKFAEFLQSFHHFVYGTYLAYTRPCLMKWVRVLFPAAVINRGLRRVFWGWLKNPAHWLKPLYFQSITIIQPPDVLPDGRVSMCDGCPDSMFYDGKIVWKCRVDELEKFGGFIQCVPKE